jgi:cyclophilin family peptidyl-prolyl cis-trans isomerase
MWALAKDEVTTTRTDIQSKKFIFLIMWNIHGFHVVDRLPAGARINGTYDIINGLQRLHQAFFPQGRNPHGKGLIVPVDNCWVHKSVTSELFMKTRDLVSMLNPPDSPDLASSNFYLFCTVKERLEHTSITGETQLFEELHKILRSIPGEELENVFKA